MKLALMKSFLLFVTGGDVSAITLFPFGIYFKNQLNLNNLRTRNHEKIHWIQQIGMFIAGIIITALTLGILMLCNSFSLWMIALLLFPFLFFYLWYVIEWFIKIFFYGKQAYMNISVEREAYTNDDNLDYTKTQKWYFWMKYIIKH